ncbi:hypothetical protein [Methylotenera sp.]|uniref:hypothetical protein n=1 Tax=Methylotenera sp. TaxID=2051956 RepID=UPI002489B125|nr:hypothetical protein [Methylotenera sp.]MDI1361818.1 hypothetical protein [Methylotenera sp.]
MNLSISNNELNLHIPNKLVFKLVKYDIDYIQFKVSYNVNENEWIAHGVAWLKADNTIAYYIRSLHSNTDTAHDLSKLNQQQACLIEQDYSLKFSDPLLDDFTLNNIQLSLAKRRRRKNF